MYERAEFTEKYERNYILIEDFKVTYENYISKTNSWTAPAFPDSNVTNFQYLMTLKQMSDVEYSKEQRDAVKTVFIHEGVLKEYIDNLDLQYNNLKALFDDISRKEKNLISNI